MTTKQKIACVIAFGCLTAGIWLAARRPASSQAKICDVDNATVNAVFQWDDGSIFVSVDKALGCDCKEGFRAGFHKNEDQKFFMSAALTALSTGKKVRIRADNVGGTCPVHGNTPRLVALLLRK